MEISPAVLAIRSPTSSPALAMTQTRARTMAVVTTVSSTAAVRTEMLVVVVTQSMTWHEDVAFTDQMKTFPRVP